MSTKKIRKSNEQDEAARFQKRLDQILREREERREAQRKQRVIELRKSFTQLSDEQIEILSYGIICAPGESGYHLGHATEDDWDSLGYRVPGKPYGHIVDDDKLIPVYHSHSVKEKRSRISADKRWKKLCAQVSPAIALAESLFVIDRLHKVEYLLEVEDLKDQWLQINQQNVVEARLALYERNDCSYCEGTGFCDDEDDVCVYCDATGESEPDLYWEHHDSFEQPDEDRDVINEEMSEQPATNSEEPFEPEQLPLPPRRVLIEMVKIGLAEQVAAIREPIVANTQRRIAARAAS